MAIKKRKPSIATVRLISIPSLFNPAETIQSGLSDLITEPVKFE
jgi:hypothetical protein